MLRYLVFSGRCFYASGGWKDFKIDFNSLEDAKNYATDRRELGDGWVHIVDSDSLTREIVFENGYAHT